MVIDLLTREVENHPRFPEDEVTRLLLEFDFSHLKGLVIPDFHDAQLQKRNFSVFHCRDFFFNKSRQLLLRNRFFRVLSTRIQPLQSFLYKRVKGGSCVGKFFCIF